MSFTVRGEAAANSALANLVLNFRRGVMGGGRAAIDIVVRQAQVSMINGPHSGIKYARLPNQSSAPGETAANQSGRMLGSIGGTNSLMSMRVYATAPHAAYLEFGTSRMAPRPVIANAVRDSQNQVTAVLGQFVWRAIE
jgi:HK97 gp10 family phage protein